MQPRPDINPAGDTGGTDEIADEMQRAAADFHTLLDNATSKEPRQGSDGTKWTNEQLLFHMLSGYLLVRNPLLLMRMSVGFPTGSRGASPRY